MTSPDAPYVHEMDGSYPFAVQTLGDESEVRIAGEGTQILMRVRSDPLAPDDAPIPFQQWIVEDNRRELGEDHPYTVASRVNLAYAYRDEGDLELAIPLFEQVVDTRQRVLGFGPR